MDARADGPGREFAQLIADQFPFHLRIRSIHGSPITFERTKGTVYSPDVLRAFSASGYGGIEVEDRLADVASPVLVLTGRHDRTCTVEASEAIANGIPDARAPRLRAERTHDVRRGARGLRRHRPELPRTNDVNAAYVSR